ncbi:uncharacterized protein BP5553_09312 [Venustampulla echinocandica]|uniref:2EXR domain-containing protein n=1 Tax=Venustampulla echinocandica TaxID=2656787 RepID=A0A370TCC8_9HELO|nr:uncharacterized protein BP5553_09312 [Venustampulla echinocandica]RDL31910.1 hypothetical protein BP5553_09312 [Venustampulla echinocandica]
MENESTPPPSIIPIFTLFPLLPPELRLRIFNEILLALVNNEHAALNKSTPTTILKIRFSHSHQRYVASTSPPVTLSISSESRAFTLSRYTYLQLGPAASHAPFSTALPPSEIPIHYPTTTLYISLRPLIGSSVHSFLYHLSTSPSRHLIRSIAVDLRIWNRLCEDGFMGVLAGMKALREVIMVVEYNREFKGQLGFLDVPNWRHDLCWLARGAGRSLKEERGRGSWGFKGEVEEAGGEVKVRCVLLTKGGEQA